MARKKKQEDEDQNDPLNPSGQDDTFGLPDINYEPLNREEGSAEPSQPESSTEPSTESAAEEPVQEETYQNEVSQEEPVKQEYRYVPPQEESSSAPMIVGILLVILLAGGATWYFMYYKPKQAEKAKQELAEKQEAERKRQEQEAADRLRREQEAAEQRRLDSLANLPKEGEIVALSERTGRYYVVVASAVDGDLIMDYAKKLSDKGVGSRIIPPFGRHKFYRISIADGDTFANAQQIADGLKGEYGDNVWVIKY